jgi:hypothetical protein
MTKKIIKLPAPGCVGVNDLVLGSVEDGAVVGQHGGDGDDIRGALVLLARQQHLRHHRVARELGHPAPHLRQLAHVVQRAESVQLFEGEDEGLVGRGVEEIEVDEVVDAEGLEQEDDVAEVDSLDLRNRVFFLEPML